MKVYSYTPTLDASGSVSLVRDRSYIADGRKRYNTSDSLYAFFADGIGFKNAATEHVYVVALDNKCHVLGCFEASHGSVNASMFPIREILQNSLILGAVNIAVSHNHPSGDVTPSTDDITATQNIKEACRACGIGFLDHIVIASNTSIYYSFCEQGDLR